MQPDLDDIGGAKQMALYRIGVAKEDLEAADEDTKEQLEIKKRREYDRKIFILNYVKTAHFTLSLIKCAVFIHLYFGIRNGDFKNFR